MSSVANYPTGTRCILSCKWHFVFEGYFIVAMNYLRLQFLQMIFSLNVLTVKQQDQIHMNLFQTRTI